MGTSLIEAERKTPNFLVDEFVGMVAVINHDVRQEGQQVMDE